MADREKVRKELGIEQLPHLPFIQSNEETQHQIGSVVKHLDDFINRGLKMKMEHDDRIKILYECLIDQNALIKNLNERTTSLLGSLRDTSTRIQETYDNFLFHAHQSADVACAVKLMFTEIHEDALTMDHYYYIVMECLNAIQEHITRNVPTTDQWLRNYVGNTRTMWDTWGKISPLPKLPYARDYSKILLKQEETAHQKKKVDKSKLKKKVLIGKLEVEKQEASRKGKEHEWGELGEHDPNDMDRPSTPKVMDYVMIKPLSKKKA